MIAYSYECPLDGVFDESFDMGTQPSSIECPVCKGDANRKFHATPNVLKGPGFYRNDSKR